MAMREKVRGMKREMKEKTIMNVDTVSLNPEHDAVVIIDQTKLPGKVEQIFLRSPEEIWQAIYLLKVRGRRQLELPQPLGSICWQNRPWNSRSQRMGKKMRMLFLMSFTVKKNIWTLPVRQR